MVSRIFLNRHLVQTNRAQGLNLPVIGVLSGGETEYVYDVALGRGWQLWQYEDSRAVIADGRHGDWIEISAERLQEARRDHAAGTGIVTPALRLVKRSGAGEWKTSVPLFGTRWTLVQDHDAPCSGAVVYLKTD